MLHTSNPLSPRAYAFALCLALGCAPEAEPPDTATDSAPTPASSESDQALSASASARGQLLHARRVRTLSAAQIATELDEEGFDTSALVHGVDLYQLIYATLDPDRHPIAASGLLVLPRTHAARLNVVSFTHGTELYKGDAPSLAEDAFLIGPALTYASAGFASVAPDYLGLGAGPGLHPYMHLPTEVGASLDLLRAARTFAARHGRTLERSVFVTGFSQGALAALGLGRALEQGGDAWFRLAALAPISGPYAPRRWIRAALAGEIAQKDATMYFAYLSVAWNRIYGLYRSPSEFFQAPYDTYLEPLLDNTHGGEELFARTPNTPLELLTPSAVARYQNPDPNLARPIDELGALCTDWTPRAPVRLYAANGDEQVPFWNGEACQSALHAHGVEAPLRDLGDADHLRSNVLATAQIVRFFAQVAR